MVIVVTMTLQELIHGKGIGLMTIISPIIGSSDNYCPPVLKLRILKVLLVIVERKHMIVLPFPGLGSGYRISASISRKVFQSSVRTVSQHPMAISCVEHTGMGTFIEGPVSCHSA